MRLGTALALELSVTARVGALDDPWPILEAIFRGGEKPPQSVYAADIKEVARIWTKLSNERRRLLKLLSRFSLSPVQALRWFDVEERKKATRSPVDDQALLENPYRIVETDLGDGDDYPVSIGVVDCGLMPESTVAVTQPVPEPSAVGSQLDPRRVRAAFVSVLRRAAENGDALLTEPDATMALAKLDLPHPCVVPGDWLAASESLLQSEITRLQVVTGVEHGSSAQNQSSRHGPPSGGPDFQRASNRAPATRVGVSKSLLGRCLCGFEASRTRRASTTSARRDRARPGVVSCSRFSSGATRNGEMRRQIGW